MHQSNIAQLSRLLCGPQPQQQPSHAAAISPDNTLRHLTQERKVSEASPLCTGLLEFFFTQTTFDFDPELSREMSPQTILDLADGAPFLLLQILAISARHLSILRPFQRDVYREQACTLQKAALLVYTSTVREVTPENCAALLVFSSLLAVQRLADAESVYESKTDVFLDRIRVFIDSMRGARLIARCAWPSLCQTKLGPILQTAQGHPKARKDSGKECEILFSLIGNEDIDERCTKACQEAIDLLQWCFDVAGTSKGQMGNTGMIFAWPATVPEEFVHLLESRTPEALVILAFYGRLLHQYRNVWFVGRTGEQLIEHITTYLGPSWSSWLAWSSQSLESDPMS